MKTLLSIFLLLLSGGAISQIKTELTPGGFPSIKIDKPNKTPEKLIEKAKSWAIYFNRNNSRGYDVYDVTESSLSIQGSKENALYYRNRGEVYHYRIVYTIRVDFSDTFYTLTFAVKDIYDGNNLTQLTVADFFAPDGRLKEDYEEVKPSLEYTSTQIVNSFAAYMATD